MSYKYELPRAQLSALYIGVLCLPPRAHCRLAATLVLFACFYLATLILFACFYLVCELFFQYENICVIVYQRGHLEVVCMGCRLEVPRKNITTTRMSVIA